MLRINASPQPDLDDRLCNKGLEVVPRAFAFLGGKVTCAAACVARINPAEIIATLSLDRIGFLLIVSPTGAGVGIVYAN
jgi:hypothetical protein